MGQFILCRNVNVSPSGGLLAIIGQGERSELIANIVHIADLDSFAEELASFFLGRSYLPKEMGPGCTSTVCDFNIRQTLLDMGIGDFKAIAKAVKLPGRSRCRKSELVECLCKMGQSVEDTVLRIQIGENAETIPTAHPTANC